MQQQARIDGLAEPVIFRETARLHEVQDSRALFEDFSQVLGAAHVRRAAELRARGHALPGVPSVLAMLAVRQGVRQTVVTGNVRSAAEVKLATFGLGRHLDLSIAAFGEDADERPDLVRIALQRARVPARHAVLLGDTPADVKGGLGGGVRAIGVATGRTTADDLREAGASVAVGDLTDTERMARLIAG
ncbi:HAD family hydrolase [Streptomyces zagrosensis]|uniref:Phosphoglycolate phosphatase-like HAD superfamily hydrolase n=1 Tax=Streptomyces zagrosensis TaxID=1042984 RepID=A0A7W9UVS4_9ACTN|nr:HAD hydrolase-like protein [Streptomyces zagrosensis]MBB5933135.1 phosphoglycolate phosphatase-like HAD superfamily hydrolase [Streptomyces zagrosensis]